MKLPIKHEYFEQIKNGVKKYEYRDAHITFMDEETGEMLRRDVDAVRIVNKRNLARDLRDSPMFDDEKIIVFQLTDNKKSEVK